MNHPSKILLIEDDLTMISLLKTLLEIEGYRVHLIPANADPLETVRQVQPDIVLMDVHLRGHNGLEVVRQIRQDEALAGTQVLLASGRDVSLEAKAAGANGFLLKPFNPDDLIAKLSSFGAQPA